MIIINNFFKNENGGISLLNKCFIIKIIHDINVNYLQHLQYFTIPQ